MYEQIASDIKQSFYQENFPNDGQRFIAWYLRNIFKLDDIQAKSCMTDGGNDRKLDAVYIDHNEATVHLIQGKFYSKEIDVEPVHECLGLYTNLKDLTHLQNNGNHKVQSKILEISQAIEEDYSIFIELVTPSSLTNAAHDDFIRCQQEMASDDTLNVEFKLIDNENLKVLYNDALNNERPYISHDFELDKDKFIELNLDGHKAVIAALPLSICYNIPGISDGSLFRKNVRQSLGISNKVNKGIANSIKSTPEDFFFCHNGITAICSSMELKENRLHVEKLNIVNGCQSLNTISNCSETIKKSNKGYILFKFYEIEDDSKCDKISTSTNSQSAVKARDLRSNDISVRAIKKAYEQMYVDGYFITKRGEKEPTDKRISKSHVVDLTNLAKWIVSWHCQRPIYAYSENKLFDKYFSQLIKRDYEPENIQALKEMSDAIFSKWNNDNPLELNEALLAMKAYAPYHQLYAISYIFNAINQMTIENVPVPKIALKRIKDNNLMETVLSMSGQCINMAFTQTNEKYQSENKVFSPANWIKQKGCLEAIRSAVMSIINVYKMMPNFKETLNNLSNGLKLEKEDFKERFSAD